MSDLVRLFEKYRTGKTAIYGLGTETEKALAVLDGAYEIIGLLDGFTEEGALYGKPIISLQYAVQKKGGADYCRCASRFMQSNREANRKLLQGESDCTD